LGSGRRNKVVEFISAYLKQDYKKARHTIEEEPANIQIGLVTSKRKKQGRPNGQPFDNQLLED
jgi:hypothetical protein